MYNSAVNVVGRGGRVVKKLFWTIVYTLSFLLVPSYFRFSLQARTELGEFANIIMAVPAIVAFTVSYAVALRNRELEETLAALDSANRQLERAYEMLREKSELDAMTGMFNREKFIATLDKMRRKSDVGTLLIIDADNFKSINDNYGHLTGDEALVLIADAIRKSVREFDVLGRIGGEEFAAFLVGARGVDATVVAERIRKTVEAIVFEPRKGTRHKLTISIGGAVTTDSQTLPELMGAADTQLYLAKNGGRNRISIDTRIPMAA